MSEFNSLVTSTNGVIALKADANQAAIKAQVEQVITNANQFRRHFSLSLLACVVHWSGQEQVAEKHNKGDDSLLIRLASGIYDAHHNAYNAMKAVLKKSCALELKEELADDGAVRFTITLNKGKTLSEVLAALPPKLVAIHAACEGNGKGIFDPSLEYVAARKPSTKGAGKGKDDKPGDVTAIEVPDGFRSIVQFVADNKGDKQVCERMKELDAMVAQVLAKAAACPNTNDVKNLLTSTCTKLDKITASIGSAAVSKAVDAGKQATTH